MTAPETEVQSEALQGNAALALIKPQELQKLGEIDRFVESLGLDDIRSYGLVTQAVVQAQAMKQLRQMIKPFMPLIMELKDTPLGFMTDRRPGTKKADGTPVSPYTQQQVEDCTLEAVLDGMPLVNNCWNIIGTRYYATQNGLWYKLLERYRVEDLRVGFGVLKSGREGALVPITALSWRYEGRPFDLVADNGGEPIPIEVRLNRGQGADAARGKAERKALNLIVKTLRGRPLPIGEVGDPEFQERANGGGGGVTVADVAGGDPEASVPDGEEANDIDIEPGGGGGADPGERVTPTQIDRLKLKAREAELPEEDLIGLCLEASAPYQPKGLEDVPASAVPAVLAGIQEHAARVKAQSEKANGAKRTLGSEGRLDVIYRTAEGMGAEGTKLVKNVLLDAAKAAGVTDFEDIPAGAETDILRSLSARVEGLKSSRRR